jgi:hypothetical protein
MSDASTRTLMKSYSDDYAPAPRFLTSLFPNQVYFHTEEVELDIERETDDVAIVIQDLSVGTRKNEFGKFTNKSFKPPIYNEEFTITAFDLMKRFPGENPYREASTSINANDPRMASAVVDRAFAGSRKLHNKVARAIELQAAQVLTTGELVLTDDAGVALFSLDFQPKSTHFVTPTAWAANGSTGAPLTDIAALAAVIRNDGRGDPKRLIFGGGAFARFLENAAVKANLASIGMQQQIQLQKPTLNPNGASFMGYIVAGTDIFEMWVYNATYKHPQTGATTPFIPTNKVVMMPESSDMRIAFGSIPRLVPPSQELQRFLPGLLSGPGYGLSPYVWMTEDKMHLKLSVGSRPLVIPTAIDTYGAITAY